MLPSLTQSSQHRDIDSRIDISVFIFLLRASGINQLEDTDTSTKYESGTILGRLVRCLEASSIYSNSCWLPLLILFRCDADLDHMALRDGTKRQLAILSRW